MVCRRAPIPRRRGRPREIPCRRPQRHRHVTIVVVCLPAARLESAVYVVFCSVPSSQQAHRWQARVPDANRCARDEEEGRQERVQAVSHAPRSGGGSTVFSSAV